MRLARQLSLDHTTVSGMNAYEFLDVVEDIVMRYYESMQSFNLPWDQDLISFLETGIFFREGCRDRYLSDDRSFPRGVFGQDVDDIIEAKNVVFGDDASLELSLGTIIVIRDDAPGVNYKLSGTIHAPGGDIGLECFTSSGKICPYVYDGHIEDLPDRLYEVQQKLNLRRFSDHEENFVAILSRQEAAQVINNMLVGGIVPTNIYQKVFELVPVTDTRRKSAAK